MANELITQDFNDFTEAEKESLASFEKNGRPGILRALEDPQITTKWFELYMSGKTYTEISHITHTKKDIILLTSRQQKWCEKRYNYYTQINDVILQKYNQAKLESMNTITTMVAALNKYFGDKFNKFISTKDVAIIESMDTKLLAQYQKAQENMDKIMGISASTNDTDPKQPAVNINMIGGKVTQKDDNTIELEPDDDQEEASVAEILSNLSKLKKVKTPK